MDEPGISGALTACGFGDLAKSLRGIHTEDASHVFELGLLEWWWDTTNTFHFPWGEITITPHDYAVLSGLPFTNRVVEMDFRLKARHSEVIRLIGPVALRLEKKEYVKCTELAKGLEMAGTTTDQKVRILILLLLAYNVVGGKSDRCNLRYPASMKDLTEVHSYDWGGLGYAALLLAMKQIVRQRDSGVNVSIGSGWRFLEVH